MPKESKTKVRTVRIADDLWEAAQAEAKRRDESVTDVIRRALRNYTRKEAQ